MKIKKKCTNVGEAGQANEKKSHPIAAGRWPGWSPVRRYISQDVGIHINQLAAVLQL